nr:phosphoribosyltransferase [Rhodococcus sp. JVH1]
MFAAVDSLRRQGPAQIVVAVPAAPESTCRDLGAMVDDVVCATMPFPFHAVGESFWNFAQVTDSEVLTLLRTPTSAGTARDAKALEFGSAATAVRIAAHDAPDGVPSLNVLLDLVGDARIVVIGESSHGTHEFMRRARKSPNGSSRTRDSRRLLRRPTGRTPTASTATCAVVVATRPPKKLSVGSSGSRRGCGGMPRYWTSSDG